MRWVGIWRRSSGSSLCEILPVIKGSSESLFIGLMWAMTFGSKRAGSVEESDGVVSGEELMQESEEGTEPGSLPCSRAGPFGCKEHL